MYFVEVKTDEVVRVMKIIIQ
ncbi:MAG: hypothetical protein HY958_08880 [Bacteroidia bacterium]|nr:hypothetical protein [Bacteroidia bacterium]